MKIKQIAAFAIGPMGAALLGFIAVPIIAWFFTPEDIGRISMLQVTVSFGILLFSLGLDQAYVREYHDSKNTPQLLKATLLPGFLLLTVTVGFLLLQPGLIARLLFDVDSFLLSFFVVVCLLASFISRFFSLILRMEEKGLAFSMSQVLPKVIFLTLIGIYIFLDLGFTLYHLIAAHVLSIVFVCLIFSWNTRKEWLASLKTSFDLNKFKEMLAYSLPLILGGLAYWGLASVDKIFLRSFSSYEELGIYSVAVNFASVALIFQSIFTTVWAPTVYKWVSTGEDLEKIHQVTRYVLLCVVLLFCLAGMLSWIIDFILPQTYHKVRYIVVACLGAPLLYTLSETTVVGIGVTKKTLYAMAASIIALFVNVIGNYLLIPRYGAAGAAASTCVAFWFFFFFRTEFSIFVWRKIPRFYLYFLTFICVLFAVCVAAWGSSLDGFMIAWPLLLLVSFFIFKKEVVGIYEYLKNL
ncbi:MAG: oligosaccharide flippase family protein [Tenuifilaceae bacterium]|nr:oligosaccharide flippase family protein [Tenuifilaceae bacterium]